MKLLIGLLAAICAILLVAGNPNAPLLAVALLCLPVLLVLSYRPRETPALMFLLGYQWLQVSMKAVHAAVLGMDVRDMLPWAPVDRAIYLGLIGLIALALGLRLALHNLHFDLSLAARQQALRLRLFDLLKLHVGLLIAVEVLARTLAIGGLAQAVFALGYLRFVTLFMIAYASVVQRRGYTVMILVLLAEVLYSLGGFFASFRLPLFVTLLAVASVPVRRAPGRLALLMVLGFFTLYMGIIWQSVKGEYRSFVNQGSNDQVVLVDRDDQWRKLWELVGSVNGEVLSGGVEGLANRFAYVDFFAYTLAYVPGAKAHTDGKLLADAVGHVLMPRMFFPNKAMIDDTAFTQAYTGQEIYSGAGTSISLGYMAETYIDFGVPGMFFADFGLGLFLGLCVRFLVSWRLRIPVLRVALLTMLVLAIGEFGTPMSKVLGGFLVPFLVTLLLVIFIEPRLAKIYARELGLDRPGPLPPIRQRPDPPPARR